MKALTICQPYARLILIGEKRVENRVWNTTHRGPLLIHAGKSRKWLDEEDVEDAIADGDPLVFGAIVGRCNLVACLRIEEIMSGKHDQRFPQIESRAHCFGPWCWVLDDVERFAEPIPCDGKQGLWDFRDASLLVAAEVAP
jgi:activating signal cointegrator 1